MFDTQKQKVDFAYFAAESYINNSDRDGAMRAMKEKYPEISNWVFDLAWRCIDAHIDLREP